MPNLGLGVGCRQAPTIGADLRPLHRGDFAAALGGQEHQLVEIAQGIAQLAERGPKPTDLVGAQNRSRSFSSPYVATVAPASIDDLLIDGPVENLTDQGKQPIGGDATPSRAF